MKIRSTAMALAAVVAVAATACGGDGESRDAPTEQGAIDAILAIQRGALEGDAGPYLDHLSADCAASIDEQQIKLAFGLIRTLMADIDVEDVSVDAAIDEFDGETASVSVTFDAPEASKDELFGFTDETMDVVYEDGEWVLSDCDFEDTSAAEAEDLAAALANLGYAGTRDDPIPVGVGAPIGGGYRVSLDEVIADAAAYIEDAGGYSSEPEPGTQTVLVRMTVGYQGEAEPAPVGDLSFTIVGGQSSVGVSIYSCGSIPEELDAFGTGLMSGGVVSGVLCGDVPVEDVARMLLSVEQGFGATSVFFDPMTTAPIPVPIVATPGPADGADLSAARQAPVAIGTPMDVGEGWTLTIRGADLDATDAVLAFSEFNDPPAAGERFVLLDASMTYNGEDDSASATFINIDLVGDHNVTSAVGSCQATIDGELDRYADVFIGGTIEGKLCAVVADADVDSLVAVATAAFGDQPVVLSVR